MGDILLKENSSIRDGLIGLIETLRQKTLPIHPPTHTTSAALAANTSSTTSLPFFYEGRAWLPIGLVHGGNVHYALRSWRLLCTICWYSGWVSSETPCDQSLMLCTS